MSDFDWLDGEAKPPARRKKKASKGGKKNPARIRGADKRPRELILAERGLRPEQRMYARLLIESRVTGEAERKMQLLGYDYAESTYRNWRRQPRFLKALKLLKAYTYEVLDITKEHVLLEAEKVRQEALTPKPILFKGKPTGIEQIELGAALRALELQGKGVGLTDSNDKRQQVNINIDFSGRQDNAVIEAEVVER